MIFTRDMAGRPPRAAAASRRRSMTEEEFYVLFGRMSPKSEIQMQGGAVMEINYFTLFSNVVSVSTETIHSLLEANSQKQINLISQIHSNASMISKSIDRLTGFVQTPQSYLRPDFIITIIVGVLTIIIAIVAVYYSKKSADSAFISAKAAEKALDQWKHILRRDLALTVLMRTRLLYIRILSIRNILVNIYDNTSTDPSDYINELILLRNYIDETKELIEETFLKGEEASAVFSPVIAAPVINLAQLADKLRGPLSANLPNPGDIIKINNFKIILSGHGDEYIGSRRKPDAFADTQIKPIFTRIEKEYHELIKIE